MVFYLFKSKQFIQNSFSIFHHRLFSYKFSFIMSFLWILLLLSGCSPKPIDQRPFVDSSPYTQGDAKNGEKLYQDYCEKCHKRVVAYNKKGPHLVNVYGSKAGILSDYQYSQVLKDSNWIWTADQIDRYISNPQQALPKTRMHTDPISDLKKRSDIIAFLSTLKEKNHESDQ